MQTDIEKNVLGCVSEDLTTVYQDSACISISFIHDSLFGSWFEQSPLQEPLEALADFQSLLLRFNCLLFLLQNLLHRRLKPFVLPPEPSSRQAL